MKFNMFTHLFPVLAVSILQVNTCSWADDSEESKDREETKKEVREQNPPRDEERGSDREEENITVDNGSASLNARIKRIDHPVKFRNTSGRPAKTGPRGAHFIHLADVSPPVTPQGDKLSATCVQLIGKYAYVSWHLNKGDEDYFGVLEVYDLNDPDDLKIRSELRAEDIDFNHVYADVSGSGKERKLWATGSESMKTKNLSSPAYLGGFVLKDERFTEERPKKIDLHGFSGNCVVQHGNALFGVSGNSKGALAVFDPATGKEKKKLKADGFKHVSVNDSHLIVLVQGKPSSRLLVYKLPDPDFNRPLRVLMVGAITPENGKNVAYLDGDMAYISTGRYGVKIYDIRSSSNVPVYTYNTLLPGAANGVSVDEEFVYIANGSSGIHVLHKDDYMLLGNFSYGGSANFTASNENYVIAASGRGGLKILRRDR